MTELVRLNRASFGYRNGKSPAVVVSDVTLSVSVGEFLVLVGPNGSGKSTLLRGLLNLVPLLSGEAVWNISGREVGYVPQESTIDRDTPATALDVVRTSAPFSWSGSHETALQSLETVGMRELAHGRFGRLSGGQRRRVLLARALFGGPRLLVLDEPTINTDAETDAQLEIILMELCRTNEVGILVATHASDWAPAARRLHVNGGRIRA
jgi:ABC-type Mn2+/Zn2+ transport system ATPase subunit